MTRREVVRRAPEVLEPLPPLDEGPLAYLLDEARQPVVVYMHPPVAEVEPAPEPSKTIPWLLIAVALAILLVACYAAWHTWVGPQLVPVRSHPVDLVGPSR